MGEEVKVIVFALGSEEYGIEVDYVKTIERMLPITRVPKTPPFVKGVVNLRGVIIPVIHLAGRFGLPESPVTESTRIVMVSAGDIELGFIVDAANDVIDLDSDDIKEPPEIVGGIRAKYLRGVAQAGEQRLIVLLNLAEVLNKSELLQIDQMELEQH